MEKHKWNTSQRALMYNGVFFTCYDGFTNAFLIPFVLVLGATNVLVGLVGAIPYIAMLTSEIFGTYLLETLKRKTIYFYFTGLSRFMWILVLLAPILFKTEALLFVIGFYLISKMLESVADPSWTTLAADLVPKDLRGAFFGKRNMMIGAASVISYLVAGFMLDLFPKTETTGFVLLFIAGLAFGVAATWVISFVKEPEYRDHSVHQLKEFFTLKGDFEKFCIFAILFNFAVMLGSPFFTVFYLKNLGMSYTFFVIATAIALLAKVIFNPFMGKMSDELGDKHVAIFGVLGASIVPILTAMITPDTLWLVIIIQFFSGIVWAAVDLSLFNLLLGFTDPKKRGVQIAEYQMLSAVPMIIAPLIGGWIADNVTFFWTGIPLVFGISSLLRVAACIFIFPLKEPRKPKSLTNVFHLPFHIHINRGFEHRIKVMLNGKKHSPVSK